VTSEMLADLAAGLLHDTNEPEMIPFGFGYADQGQKKYNLNTNLSPGGVLAIASIINRNLPQFASLRAGAMDPTNYLNNIAANIVDYADSGSSPNVGPGQYPGWRGVEAIPWPNEIFMRFELVDRTSNGANFEFQLGVKHFIEVWNLSSKPVTFTPAVAEIYNDLNVALKCDNWDGNLSTVDPTNQPTWEAFTNASVTLQPNSYSILGAPTRVFKFNVPATSVGSTNPPLTISPPVGGSVQYGKYAVRLDGIVVDGASMGRHPGIRTNMVVGDFHYIVSACGFGLTRGAGQSIAQYNLAGGDPRGQLFFTDKTMALPYINSTPGSRNRLLQAIGLVNTVNPPVNWPDRGHSVSTDLGPSPVSSGSSVTTFANLAGDQDHYVQKISDAGAFSNVLELGNIFDPISWADANNPFFPLDPAAWMLLTGGSNISTTNGAACGRNTLRIGRFEHPRFNTNGARAVQLLDIFAVGPAVGAAVTHQVAAKININTAGTNVLKALAGGVANSSDPALLPDGLNYYVPTNAVRAFVDAVTRFRSNAPFLSPAQLASISTNSTATQWPTNAVFGNLGTNATKAGDYFGNSELGGTTSSIREWSDQAAEEWFGKIYPLATVRSRNFLVHAVGQALRPGTTSVLSTSMSMFQLSLRPLRANSSGLTTNSVPTVVQSWNL
jgi:hypothetical protein